jgi:hypothetical protein
MPALNLAFVVGLLTLLPTVGQGALETPLRIVLLLGMIAAVLTFILVGVAIAAWVQGHWPVLARLHYTALAAAGILFTLVLNIWNLLGWRL